jgi:hypothetical protein
VLSQLDETYFAGLEGAYSFELQFRVEKDGDDENDYLVHSHGNYAMNRSVSTDISLEAGTYWILMKVTARPNGICEIEEALPGDVDSRREKLIQMGLSYDLAHAKGIIVETEKEKKEREERKFPLHFVRKRCTLWTFQVACRYEDSTNHGRLNQYH